MSQEVFEIVKGMDQKSIETQLALQCAPLIAGLKISNLLIVSNESVKKIRRILRGTSIRYYILLTGAEKTTLLLYHMQPLQSYLKQKEVAAFLRKLGYTDMAFGALLRTFAGRYAAHMSGRAAFPHEMGLFLGYPVEDVSGFMENGGKNFLYAGYWKVYQNAEEKRRLFAKFDLAKEALIQLIANGVSMPDVMDIYNNTITVQNRTASCSGLLYSHIQ